MAGPQGRGVGRPGGGGAAPRRYLRALRSWGEEGSAALCPRPSRATDKRLRPAALPRGAGAKSERPVVAALPRGRGGGWGPGAGDGRAVLAGACSACALPCVWDELTPSPVLRRQGRSPRRRLWPWPRSWGIRGEGEVSAVLAPENVLDRGGRGGRQEERKAHKAGLWCQTAAPALGRHLQPPPVPPCAPSPARWWWGWSRE